MERCVVRKVGDIMKEMGFSKDSSPSVQEAFVRHLIKSAYGKDVRSPSQDLKLVTEKELVQKPAEEKSKESAQLSFDFAELVPQKVFKKIP